jgi:GDP-L-fucose synthase
MKKNILITGGHGLLGSCLDFGFKPDRNELDLFNFTELDAYIKENKIQSVIHCAAKVGGVKANMDAMYDYFIENALLNINVLRAIKNNNLKRSITISSTCIFPDNASLPFSEEVLHDGPPHNSNYGYSYSKRLLDIGLKAMFEQYKIDSINLIPCNLYGVNDNYNINDSHVIPSLIHKCYLAKLNKGKFEIWGSGKAEREFLFANDLGEIIKTINDTKIKISGSVIISPDETYKIKDIVEIIAKKLEFDGEIVFDQSKPEGVLKKSTSNNKFREIFPAFEFTTIEKGIDLTVDGFLKNYKELRK